MVENRRYFYITLFVGLLVGLSGCQAAPTPPPANIVHSATTVPPTSTWTPEPTTSPTSSPTPTETLTPTQTKTPTETPIPWESTSLNPTNASQLNELASWGLGAPSGQQFIPEHNLLLVRTAVQQYFYDATSFEPRIVLTGRQLILFSPDHALLITTQAPQDNFNFFFSPEAPPQKPSPDIGTIKIWNPVDGSLLQTIKHEVEFPEFPGPEFSPESYAGVQAFVFSPDGGLLAAGYGDTQIAIWDTSNWQLVTLLSSNVTNVPGFMAFSPDNKYLAVTSNQASLDGFNFAPRLQLWDLERQELISYLTNPGRISDFPFSADSEYLATGNDFKVFIWKLPEFGLETSFAGGSDFAPRSRFSKDGTHLIIDGEIVRRLPDGKRLNLEDEQAYLLAEGLSPPEDQTQSVTIGDPQLARLGHLPPFSGIRILGDREFVAWGWHGTQFYTWQIQGEAFQMYDLPAEPVIPQTQPVLAPDNGEFAFCLQEGLAFFDWVANTWRFGERCKAPGSLVYRPDGSQLFVGSGLLVDQVDPLNGLSTGSMRGHSLELAAVAISPDGALVGSSTTVVRDGAEVFLWHLDPAALWQRWRISSGSRSPISALKFSPDGSLLAIGGSDSLVKLYRVDDGWQLENIPAGIACSMEFSPDGQLLAVGTCFGQLSLIDVEAGEIVSEIKAHEGRIFGIQFLPVGRGMLTTGTDGMIRLWGSGAP